MDAISDAELGEGEDEPRPVLRAARAAVAAVKTTAAKQAELERMSALWNSNFDRLIAERKEKVACSDAGDCGKQVNSPIKQQNRRDGRSCTHGCGNVKTFDPRIYAAPQTTSFNAPNFFEALEDVACSEKWVGDKHDAPKLAPPTTFTYPDKKIHVDDEEDEKRVPELVSLYSAVKNSSKVGERRPLTKPIWRPLRRRSNGHLADYIARCQEQIAILLRMWGIWRDIEEKTLAMWRLRLEHAVEIVRRRAVSKSRKAESKSEKSQAANREAEPVELVFQAQLDAKKSALLGHVSDRLCQRKGREKKEREKKRKGERKRRAGRRWLVFYSLSLVSFMRVFHIKGRRTLEHFLGLQSVTSLPRPGLREAKRSRGSASRWP